MSLDEPTPLVEHGAALWSVAFYAALRGAAGDSPTEIADRIASEWELARVAAFALRDRRDT